MNQSETTLVIDLDGTLLRGNMLHECLWSAMALDWRSPFRAVFSLSSGRAALKHQLARDSRIDPTTLPYNEQVIRYVEDWRDRGGRAALVTASDQDLARAIAVHLGIFDEVHGSDGVCNLKGDRKATFLEERFGLRAFAYMGDAPVDLAVWARAKTGVTIDASRSLRRDAERICANMEHLYTTKRSCRSYLQALRPHQWLKNLLVFLPMLVAHKLELHTALLSLLAFMSFSLIASSVYVVNDLLDLSADRVHPRKRHRPFASGKVPIEHGSWMATILILFGTTGAIIVGLKFAFILASYFALTTAYSMNLKRRIVIDICVLAGLYTLRIVAGGVATAIPLSVWLLAFSIFFFLSLAAVKRQAELIDSNERGALKASGRGYHVNDLPIISMIAIGAGYVSVLVMVLYVDSDAVRQLYRQPEALWGVCAVLLYWLTRTVMVAHRGFMHDDPVVYAAKDRISQLCILLILCFVIAGAVW